MSKDVRARGLGDLRTMTTHHIAAKPPRKGTTYLDLFALSMEKQRLEQELTGLERRRNRLLARLADAKKSMDKIISGETAQGIGADRGLETSEPATLQAGGRRIRRVPVEY